MLVFWSLRYKVLVERIIHGNNTQSIHNALILFVEKCQIFLLFFRKKNGFYGMGMI